MNPYETPGHMARFLLDREKDVEKRRARIVDYVRHAAEVSARAGFPEQAGFWRGVEREIEAELAKRGYPPLTSTARPGR